MRSIPIIIVYLFLHLCTRSQSKISVEQYSFVGAGRASLLEPVAHYQSKTNWYAEARYNYEDVNTFSFYAGYNFSHEKKISWSLTPIAGAMAGKLTGASFGLNSECSYKKFFFSSQAQYSASFQTKHDNFFYNWSEFCYQPWDWFYTGIAFQHTRLYASNSIIDPGILISFSYKQLNFPVYAFSPFACNRYFVAGINWEWKQAAAKHKNINPSLLLIN